MKLDALTHAWLLSAHLHTMYPRATDDELKSAETEIGSRLPSELRDLYQFSSGPYLLDGNLQIYPLRKSEDRAEGLTTISTKLREWKWPVPIEVLIFANNGSESKFGLWLPATRSSRYSSPVVQIEPGSKLAVVGTDIVPFLLGWTAYYLLLLEADSKSLDAIGVPHELRDQPQDDDLFAALRKWADPALPDFYPDPYGKGYTAENLKQLFGVPG